MLGAIECEHRHTRIDLDYHRMHASKYTTPRRAQHAVSSFISLVSGMQSEMDGGDGTD
jgi:hypothetical protein